jgi:hypothetical protein
MNNEERAKKAVELVVDNSKQLITIAAAILTLTIAFIDKLKPTLPHSIWRWPVIAMLVIGWAVFIASMWTGFKTLEAISKI